MRPTSTSRCSARLVLTAGEPAGIGPDVCLATLTRDWPCELVIAGNRAVLESRAAALKLSLPLRDYDPKMSPRRHRPGEGLLIDLPTAAPVIAGKLDARNANSRRWSPRPYKRA
jgi:4-hydroxythreonine-4-phosphate dehydrogenase